MTIKNSDISPFHFRIFINNNHSPSAIITSTTTITTQVGIGNIKQNASLFTGMIQRCKSQNGRQINSISNRPRKPEKQIAACNK